MLPGVDAQAAPELGNGTLAIAGLASLDAASLGPLPDPRELLLDRRGLGGLFPAGVAPHIRSVRLFGLTSNLVALGAAPPR